MNIKTNNKILTIDECYKLLGITSVNDPIINEDSSCFDIYGNYSFPSDYNSSTPNTASGVIAQPPELCKIK